MSDMRKRGIEWGITPNSDGSFSFTAAQLAVLMDIRDELKRLNGTLHCVNFLRIPSKLEAIRRNTAKPRKVKK